MKKKSMLALLFLCSLLLFKFGFGIQSSGLTEAEPNNSIREAQKITFPGALSGSLEGSQDRDFFRLDIPPGGLDTLDIQLKIQGNYNPALRFLDKQGKTLTEADFFKAGQDEYLTSLDVRFGPCYVVVDRGVPKGKEDGSYTLILDQLPELDPSDVRAALNKALDYIVSQQLEDGSFSDKKGDSGGIPSMAVQALMGADCLERDDWGAIYKGIDFLSSLYHDPAKEKNERLRQLHGGAIYRRDEMYDHGMALTTLIEAHALGVEGLSDIIQGGLDFLYRAQLTEERPPDLNGPIPGDSKYFGGWRYMANSTDADLSVTAWQVIALIAAGKAGFEVPRKRLSQVLEFVRRCYVEGEDTFAYMPQGQYGPPCRAGMGALSLQLLGSGTAPEVKNAVKYMLTRSPSWLGEFKGNYPFYYWYYGTRAAFLEGGRTWDLWSRAACGMLVRHQNREGSWDLAFNELRNTSKVYVTALGALILEFCCGSVPIYMRQGEAPPRPPAPARNEIAVSIANPKSNTKLQGEIEIEALPVVPENTTVQKVSFFVDGEKIGELEAAPWILKTNLGPGVEKHVIKVIAENNFGKEAEAEVQSRTGTNMVRVRIKSPRQTEVLGKQAIDVEASGHPESPLESVAIFVKGEEIFKGKEPPFKADYDFGQIGGFEIRAVAVNVLGREAEDRVVTREARPIEVDLTITVTDEANNYILDLKQEDFSVLEDEVPQDILQFSTELTPVSMALVLDTSGSMRRRMDSVQKAASQFVSQIKPVDRAMIMEFSDGVRMTQGLTSDIPALKRAIEKTAAKGGTALYDAVIDAVRRLQREKGRTSVILLTDGKDENNAGTAAGSQHSLAECVETAKEAGVTIYTLGLGANIERDVLTQIALQTGGRAYFPPTVADLAEVYGKIAKELRSQYTISYSSSNRTRNGAWRAIEIKIAGHSYIIRTKPGYLAPKR